jgi:hypothetical protein
VCVFLGQQATLLVTQKAAILSGLYSQSLSTGVLLLHVGLGLLTAKVALRAMSLIGCCHERGWHVHVYDRLHAMNNFHPHQTVSNVEIKLQLFMFISFEYLGDELDIQVSTERSAA